MNKQVESSSKTLSEKQRVTVQRSQYSRFLLFFPDGFNYIFFSSILFNKSSINENKFITFSGVLLKRFRNLKWVYSFTAKYYYFLNLGCFYTPLLVFGTTNTILASIIIDESADNISSLVIKISTVVSVLTGKSFDHCLFEVHDLKLHVLLGSDLKLFQHKILEQ